MNHFQDDPHCMTSLRSDDYVVDSSFSPVSILLANSTTAISTTTNDGTSSATNTHNNPWALGHVINHPAAGQNPNTLSCMVNFMTSSSPSSSSTIAVDEK